MGGLWSALYASGVCEDDGRPSDESTVVWWVAEEAAFRLSRSLMELTSTSRYSEAQHNSKQRTQRVSEQ